MEAIFENPYTEVIRPLTFAEPSKFCPHNVRGVANFFAVSAFPCKLPIILTRADVYVGVGVGSAVAFVSVIVQASEYPSIRYCTLDAVLLGV